MLSDDEIREKGHARIKAFLEIRVDQAHMDAAQKRFEETCRMHDFAPLAHPWDYDDYAFLISQYFYENEGTMPTAMLFGGVRLLNERRESQYRGIEDAIDNLIYAHRDSLQAKNRPNRYDVERQSIVAEEEDLDELPGDALERGRQEREEKKTQNEHASQINNIVEKYVEEALPALNGAIEFLEEDYRIIHTPEGEGQTHSIINDIEDNPLLKALFEQVQAGGEYNKDVILDRLTDIRAEEQQWREIGISRISDEDLSRLETETERFTEFFPDHEALLVFMRGLQGVQRDAEAADRAIIAMTRQYRDDLLELIMDLECIKDGREPPERDSGWTGRTRSDEPPGLSP